MKYYRILLLLTASLALFSCKKDEEEPIKEPVEGTVLVSGVRVNGVNASLDSETNTFTTILPAETDFSSMELSFATKANSILLGDRELTTSNTDIDMTEPIVIRFTQKGVYQDYTFAAKNTGLPGLRCRTVP